MSEFHLSRFIVGVHIAGLLLIPIGIESILSRITHHASRIIVTLLLCFFVTLLVFPQTLRYASHNDFLISRANKTYAQEKSDVQLLITRLSAHITQKPGRVFAGRGGSWGKNFRIAETPMYMHLSTYGIPVILWLPETWSPNSDTEQYFSENNPDHYTLYNVRYVVTPANGEPVEPQPFWRLVEAGETWKLYSVDADIPSTVEGSRQNDTSFGYITTGIRPAIVSADKQDYRSVVRLWMHSDAPKAQLYPELTFDKTYPKNTCLPAGRPCLPNFRMTDEATYKVPDGSFHNLFSEVPRYLPPTSPSSLSFPNSPTLLSQSSDSDMVFRATVDVPSGCTECIVILKQTFHPSWRATVDGKPATTMTVFPFYTAVKIESSGKHDIVFSYEPSGIKKVLLIVSFLSLGILIWFSIKPKLPQATQIPQIP